MTAKDILKISQDMQALAIMAESVKLAKNKKKLKDYLDTGMKTIFGTGMMRVQADIIGSM